MGCFQKRELPEAEGIVGEIVELARNLPQNLTLEEALAEYEEDGVGWRNERYRERRSHRRYGGRQREDGIDGVKVRIRTFKGTRDPKVYLEWEMKVEQVFAC